MVSVLPIILPSQERHIVGISIWALQIDFCQLPIYIQGSFMLSHGLRAHFFLLLNNISLYGYNTIFYPFT